jgi:sialate O-acetylesterase
MRVQFGHDMPLLIVQLSDFGPTFTQPGESGWAELREAQRQVADDDAHSALAVTVDIGSGYALHPPNKQELGLRLARAARHVVYGEKTLSPSGPVPLSVRRDGDAVTVRFGQVEKGLVVHGADEPIGFELCGADAGSCRYARATVDGDVVAVRAANAASATRVRYGWADSPVVNFFDGNGLPVVPFQLPVPSP